jgi:H+/Cl- antiporter ClcA
MTSAPPPVQGPPSIQDPEPSSSAPRHPARDLLAIVLPAIVVGVGSSVTLIALSRLAAEVEHVLWDWLPMVVGLPGTEPIWIFLVLTAAGLATGLILTFVPGHAGPDPATAGLVEPPQPLFVLPGLALALVVTLAGGVSLGPENPIIGLNLSLAVLIGLRLLPRVPARAWGGLAFAGTIGAMFGTPIAAALLLAETVSEDRRPLWDRIFGPLVAAGAGSVATLLLAGESFVLDVDPYRLTKPVDVVTGSVIAIAVAVIGLAAVYAFPRLYLLFGRLGSPLVIATAGGALLGVLGAIGGPITLFKGLEQMHELSADVDAYTVGGLALVAIVKLLALLVAGTTGFRGGRIFPATFVAVALGLTIHAAFPQVPEAVALAASLIGMLLAVTRSGFLALFLAALMVGHPEMLPLLCLIILPAWLVVTGRPEMVAAPRPSDRPATVERR